jgi:predicted regulator of Ras-like GTPase activity (Roadblock/LC7/MglB family)
MADEYREERLMRVLREQINDRIEGVQKSVIVTNEGLVVAAYPKAGEARNAHKEIGSSFWVAALAAEIIAQGRRAFGELAKGSVNRVLIDGESGSMIVIPAGEEASLAVMVNSDVKLGLAMHQVARVAEQVGGLLG